MQVVVPYRPGMLFARTYDAAKAWEGGCQFVLLRNDDEKPDPSRYNPTYPELLADLWDEGEGVIMLEHDVVPYEQSIMEIAYCREPWCGYSYPGGPMTKISCNLGCTKISAEFMAATAAFGQAERRQRRWDECDARLARWTYAHTRIRPHRHHPDLQHRQTRRIVGHALGDEFIELDEQGKPLVDRVAVPLASAPVEAVEPVPPVHDEAQTLRSYVRDVAEMLDVQREDVRQWEYSGGVAYPSPAHTEALAALYGVSVEFLLADRRTIRYASDEN